MLVGKGLSRAHGGFEAFKSVRPKIWRVSRRAGREIWKTGAAVVDSSRSSSSLSLISCELRGAAGAL